MILRLHQRHTWPGALVHRLAACALLLAVVYVLISPLFVVLPGWSISHRAGPHAGTLPLTVALIAVPALAVITLTIARSGTHILDRIALICVRLC